MSAARPTARNRFDDGTKLNPTASAPIATASSASSSLVIPQILTNTREGYRAPPLRRATVAALLSSAGCGAAGGRGRAAIAGGYPRPTQANGTEPGGRARPCVGGPPAARPGDQ